MKHDDVCRFMPSPWAPDTQIHGICKWPCCRFCDPCGPMVYLREWYTPMIWMRNDENQSLGAVKCVGQRLPSCYAVTDVRWWPSRVQQVGQSIESALKHGRHQHMFLSTATFKQNAHDLLTRPKKGTNFGSQESAMSWNSISLGKPGYLRPCQTHCFPYTCDILW